MRDHFQEAATAPGHRDPARGSTECDRRGACAAGGDPSGAGAPDPADTGAAGARGRRSRGGAGAGVTKLTMLVESEPAGATIVVDGLPVGKTPLRLGVPATVLGFFREYVEIRARFIAENETEVSQTATEEFSPREKVPAALHFTPAGARRTVRE